MVFFLFLCLNNTEGSFDKVDSACVILVLQAVFQMYKIKEKKIVRGKVFFFYGHKSIC